MIDTGDDYVALQKEQLAVGARSDDAYIFNLKTGSDQYSPAYARYKGKDFPIDLRNTGAFYDGIIVEATDGGLNVRSDDEKNDMLQKTYGAKIFGLGTDNKEKYIEIVRPDFVEAVKEVLGV